MPATAHIASAHVAPASGVASVDILVLPREEGKASMIAWNGGSLIDHVVVIVEEPETGEPYVIESFGPTKVRKILYTEYIKQYGDKYHNMVYLPLKEEYSKVFDADEACHLFSSTSKGYQHGWENIFFFGLRPKATVLVPDSIILQLVSRGKLLKYSSYTYFVSVEKDITPWLET